MWEEIARTEEHLDGSMETLGSGNFLKYAKAFLMMSPNIEKDRDLTSHLLSPNDAFSTRIGLNPIVF